jgi:hypothetical protein
VNGIWQVIKHTFEYDDIDRFYIVQQLFCIGQHKPDTWILGVFVGPDEFRLVQPMLADIETQSASSAQLSGNKAIPARITAHVQDVFSVQAVGVIFLEEWEQMVWIQGKNAFFVRIDATLVIQLRRPNSRQDFEIKMPRPQSLGPLNDGVLIKHYGDPVSM